MMCIVLKGKDWRGRRSVEVLGFHHKDLAVQVLFLLYMENTAAIGTANFLDVLHPGNCGFELIEKPWPPPLHQDIVKKHPQGNGPDLLSSVYKKAFNLDESTQHLSQVQGLSAWDSWYGCGIEDVTIWPIQEKDFPNEPSYMKIIPPEPLDNIDAPFTTFRLGPFNKTGPILIAFKLWLTGQIYTNLVAREPIFTVDGPERLLLRTECEHIQQMPKNKQKPWQDGISPFKDYLSFGESYDVILLNEPYADKVEVVWKGGMNKAPIQPKPENIGTRYISANSSFSLWLKYASVNIFNEMKESAKKRYETELHSI